MLKVTTAFALLVACCLAQEQHAGHGASYVSHVSHIVPQYHHHSSGQQVQQNYHIPQQPSLSLGHHDQQLQSHQASSYSSVNNLGAQGHQQISGHLQPQYHQVQVQAPQHHEEHYPHHHPKYEYKYGVEDKHTHDIKSQHETRDGDHVEGEYSLLQPDGRTRIVKYSSDKHSGFNAQVTYSGHASHPQHQPHHH